MYLANKDDSDSDSEVGLGIFAINSIVTFFFYMALIKQTRFLPRVALL